MTDEEWYKFLGKKAPVMQASTPAVAPTVTPPIGMPQKKITQRIPSANNAVRNIIENDRTPPYNPEYMQNGGSSFNPTFGDSPLIDKYLKILEENKPKKSSSIIDAIMSGVGSIASSMSHNQPAADSIMQGFEQRQGERNFWNKGAKQMLMQSLLKKIGTGESKDVINYQYLAGLSPEEQEKFYRVLQAGNPLQNMLANILGGNQ